NQGSVLGNPQLAPERAESWDAGLDGETTWRGVRASLEWAHFTSHARDLIVYVRNSQSSVRAQNIARAEIDGDELSARLAGRHLTWSAFGTLQSAIDRGSVPFWYGRTLPQRPPRWGGTRLD